MELTLTRQSATQVKVICDDQPSHTFDLSALMPNDMKELPQSFDDTIAYGKTIFQALFPSGTPAFSVLESIPERIMLVLTDNELDAIPWEYAYGPEGYLALEYHFVRGLPVDERIPSPTLDSGLHIVVVPSDPLSIKVDVLNIDGEWLRLKEIVESIPYALTLERTRPPTIENLRFLLARANQRNRVMHFMGHGGQNATGAFLCFERENGDLEPVTAKEFVRRVRGTVFLVTINACASAAPGPALFSNLIAALAKHKVPYALGMRLSIYDDDAHVFSRNFYSDLASGTPVEEALLQARLTLAKSARPWSVGVPVLYTALRSPVAGFTSPTGAPTVIEHQPYIEIEGSALPRSQGVFQGRIEELKELGKMMTGDKRPQILTIHGGGGQGKTALARVAIERFAHAWPGGIWATSLENVPGRETFVNQLAQFLPIDTQQVLDLDKVERLVLAYPHVGRTLIVLDNAETLIEAVESNDKTALDLVQFIMQLPGPAVSLLVTSRRPLEWNGEVSFELGGLVPEDGAQLFRQCAPNRINEIDPVLAKELSEKLKGHPLGLRLLGAAFNSSAILLRAFLQDCEVHLVRAENKFMDIEHRHRTLNACIEMSIRYLNADLRALLSGLWVFHTPFLSERAVALFDPNHKDTEEDPSSIHDRLYTLWQRSLLTREIITVRDGTLTFYQLLPTTRPYIEHYLEQVYEREIILSRFGEVYMELADFIYNQLDESAVAVTIAKYVREDLERGIENVKEIAQGSYLLRWGWILYRLGSTQRGLALLERALEIVQGKDRPLESQVCNNMAEVYQAIGKPQEAFQLLEQALALDCEVGNRVMEATTLNNMGEVYQAIGKLQEAFKFYEQALPITQEVGNRAREAIILNNMAAAYRTKGKSQKALRLLEQALTIHREVGNRTMEATTLNDMALVCQTIGKPQEALKLYKQALPITQEVGNRAGEATTLNNIALVYQATGKPQEAFKFYEQALPITQEVGNRAMEATILNNLAALYQATGKPREALKLLEQALPIHREVGNRVMEATTLNNMGEVCRTTWELQEALKLYEQALPIIQEVGNRAGEATICNNMALVYQATGKPQEALKLLEQALPIAQGAGSRAGEAATLKNMATAYETMGKPQEALKLLEQALPIAQEVGNRAGEATILTNIALLMYRSPNYTEEAIHYMGQAINVLVTTDLLQDADGRKVEDLQNYLLSMRAGNSLDT